MKIVVSLDGVLVARLDAEARKRGLTRSALLAELAAARLGQSDQPDRPASARRALAALDRLFADQGGEDSTAAVRAQRDVR